MKGRKSSASSEGWGRAESSAELKGIRIEVGGNTGLEGDVPFAEPDFHLGGKVVVQIMACSWYQCFSSCVTASHCFSSYS